MPLAPARTLPVPESGLASNEVSRAQRRFQQQLVFVKSSGDMRAMRFYLRVSQEDQSDLSLEAQLTMLVAFCVNQQLAIAGIYWDKKSGKNFRRPGFRAMMKAIRRDGPGGVMVVRMDRFGRNWFEGVLFLWLLWTRDCPLYYPEHDFFPIQVRPAAMGIPGARLNALSQLDGAEARNHHKGNQIRASNRKAWENGYIPAGWHGRLPFIEVKDNGRPKKKKRMWGVLAPDARASWDRLLGRLRGAPTWSAFRGVAKDMGLGEPRSLIRYLRMRYVRGEWSDPSMEWMSSEPWGEEPLVSEEEWDELQDLLVAVELDREREAHERASKLSALQQEIQTSSIRLVGALDLSVVIKCRQGHEIAAPKVKQSRGHGLADWMHCAMCKEGFMMMTQAQKEAARRHLQEGGSHLALINEILCTVPEDYRHHAEIPPIMAKILEAAGADPEDVRYWLRQTRSLRRTRLRRKPRSPGLARRLEEFR